MIAPYLLMKLHVAFSSPSGLVGQMWRRALALGREKHSVGENTKRFVACVHDQIVLISSYHPRKPHWRLPILKGPRIFVPFRRSRCQFLWQISQSSCFYNALPATIHKAFSGVGDSKLARNRKKNVSARATEILDSLMIWFS